MIRKLAADLIHPMVLNLFIEEEIRVQLAEVRIRLAVGQLVVEIVLRVGRAFAVDPVLVVDIAVARKLQIHVLVDPLIVG